MKNINSKKEAIELLFQELYESGTEIWADQIHEALLYLADDAECFNIVEQLNEEIAACDIVVIHRQQANEIVAEEIDKATGRIGYRLDTHCSLADREYGNR